MSLSLRNFLYCLLSPLFFLAAYSDIRAQAYVNVSANADAQQVAVGDQVHIFLNVQNKPALSNVQWAVLPDSIPHLEILERGRIDTIRQGAVVNYRQRIVITGFDSGRYYFPSLQFSVLPKNGTSYVLTTDSVPLLVQTVAVDTTKAFKPIKGILEVRSTWRDYIWLIIGGVLLVILIVWMIWYFQRHKGTKLPQRPATPQETLQEKAMRLLHALEAEQLWQKGEVKAYYVRLTDIVRGYIEARFDTPALELTTDELIDKARQTRDLLPVAAPLQTILQTADLAKFAKAQPMPQEHLTAMQLSKDIIAATAPAAAIDNTSTPTLPKA